MAYIQGEGRGQGSLFPVVLDDLIPADHMCRVIDAFVAKLALLILVSCCRGFPPTRCRRSREKPPSLAVTGCLCSLFSKKAAQVLIPASSFVSLSLYLAVGIELPTPGTET